MDNFDENIWKVAQELGSNERHFNQLQHQYRAGGLFAVRFGRHRRGGGGVRRSIIFR